MTANRLLTGVLSSWAGFVVTATTSLVMAPFLVHQLGDAGYGLWALYMSITGYFTLLDFGISPAIVRYVSKYHAQKYYRSQQEVVSTGLAFFLGAGFFILGVATLGYIFYARIFPESQVPLASARLAFALIALDFALSLPAAVFQGVLLGHQHYLLLNGLNIFIRLLRFTLVLGLVHRGPWALVVVAGIFLATGFLRDIALAFGALQNTGVIPDRRMITRSCARELISYSLPAFIISMAIRLISYTDSMVIAYVIGVEAITYFALASSLVDYVQEIGWGLAGVLVPVVSAHETHGELQAIRERFLAFSRYCTWLVVLILALCIGLGEAFFTRWIGPDYALSAFLMVILMVAMAVYVVQMPGQAVLKGMSRHKPLAALMISEAVFNLGLSIFLAHRYGVVGVAFGTLIPRVLLNGFGMPLLVLPLLGIRFRSYLRAVFVPALPAAFVLITLNVLGRSFFRPPVSWLEMVAIGVVFVVFFVPAAYLGALPADRAWSKSFLFKGVERIRREIGLGARSESKK